MAEAPKQITPPGAWKRLRRDRRFILGGALFTIIAGIAIFGVIPLGSDAGGVTGVQFSSPSKLHFFGTDLNGRDVYVRVLEGARISIVVGLAGALVSLVIGTTY